MRKGLAVLAFLFVLGVVGNDAEARILELRPPAFEPTKSEVDLFPERLSSVLDEGGGSGWAIGGGILVGLSTVVGVLAAIPIGAAIITLARSEDGMGDLADAFIVMFGVFIGVPVFLIAVGGVAFGLWMMSWGEGGGDGIASRTERPVADRRFATMQRPPATTFALPAFTF